MHKINKLYNEYERGTISLDELKKHTLELVYKEKPYFTIEKLTSDTIGDLILLLNKSLDSIIKKFNSQKGSYSTYIRYAVITIKKNLFLRYVKKTSNEKAVYKYVFEEYDLYTKDPEPNYNETESNLNINFKKLIDVNKVNNISEKDKIFVLLLKSCNYLQEEHLEQISLKYHISLEEIKEVVNQGKALLTKRIDRNEKINLSKSRLYLLKNRYENQLELLHEDRLVYQSILKSLEISDKRWANFTKKNQERAITLSNTSIGKILNIPYHSVNIFLNCVHKKYGKNYKKSLS